MSLDLLSIKIKKLENKKTKINNHKKLYKVEKQLNLLYTNYWLTFIAL